MTARLPRHEDGRFAAVAAHICVPSDRGANAEWCLRWRWSHLRQRGTSQLVCEHSQTSTFLITELQASPVQVRPQHSILFPQERDHGILLAQDPTAEGRDEPLGRRHGRILRQPRSIQFWDSTGAAYRILGKSTTSSKQITRDSSNEFSDLTK
jgi:hypothetical protein